MCTGLLIEKHFKKMLVNQEQEQKDIERTKELLKESKPEAAFELLQHYSDEIDEKTPFGKEWLQLLIQTSEILQNTNQLVILYDYYPKIFENHEKASLLVANAYLEAGRYKDYQAVRDRWQNHEKQPELWFILEGDKLLLEGKRQEALNLLNSKSFIGQADVPRLTRLALLYLYDNPKLAWDKLAEAYEKDPHNADIRSYRAKMLETYNKVSLAQAEYIAAIQTNPANLLLRDQLAEFYVRHQQYASALSIWMESLKPPSSDTIWLKALFWSKVAVPVMQDWTLISMPSGSLTPLLNYLIHLPKNQFWDQGQFEKILTSKELLKTEQAIFWLRLLDLLKQGKEPEAYQLIQYNSFHNTSWSLPLEEALQRLLFYRQHGKFSSSDEESLSITEDKNQSLVKPDPVNYTGTLPFYFAQLAYYDEKSSDNTIQLPDDLLALIKGPDAFTAAFLAIGWNEAALQLNSLSVIPTSYPTWLVDNLIQVTRNNRGVAAALEFATLQTVSPAINLIVGELLISSGNQEAALERLLPLVKLDDASGYRAAWLVSLIYIEKGHYAEAKKILQDQPSLNQSVLGKETTARMALLEGNKELAERLYISIEKESPEAQSYFARQAFLNRDWRRAQELTEKLILIYPTNPLLQQNLKEILEEQKKDNLKKVN